MLCPGNTGYAVSHQWYADGLTPPPCVEPCCVSLQAEKEWQQYSAHNKPPPLSPKPRASGAPLQQALYQGKVLRFYCCWAADSGGSRDAPLPYVLHYYLADDCVEVREVHPRNDGRYPFPMLLSKRRLPKNIPPVGQCRCRAPVTLARLKLHLDSMSLPVHARHMPGSVQCATPLQADGSTCS